MYQILSLPSAEIIRARNFRIGAQPRRYRCNTLNDQPIVQEQHEDLWYIAELRLLLAAVIPDSHEIIGTLRGYPPGLAIDRRKSILKEKGSIKAEPTIRRLYAELQTLLRENYFLIASATLKEGIDQQHVLYRLLGAMIKQVQEQQFSGIVFIAQHAGLQRFLPSVDFNLIDDVRHIYFRPAC